jgi:hypothetical protein
VSDNHSPVASNTRSFTVVVAAAAQVQVTASISAQRQCVLNWNTRAGARYRVYYKTVLQPGAWQQLADVDGTGSAVNYTDPGSGSGTRFYRLEVLP